jgi:hypothetical protein
MEGGGAATSRRLRQVRCAFEADNSRDLARSALYQSCPNAPQQKRLLFDHLVDGNEQLVGHGEADHPRGLEVDDQFELGCCATGTSAGLSALEDSTGVDADLTPCIRNVTPVAHQPANFDKLAPRIRSGHPMMRRQVDQLDTPTGEKGIDVDENGIGPLAHKSCKSRIDLATGAGVEHLNFQPDCASSRLRVSQRAFGIGTGRVDEHGKWLRVPAHAQVPAALPPAQH